MYERAAARGLSCRPLSLTARSLWNGRPLPRRAVGSSILRVPRDEGGTRIVPVEIVSFDAPLQSHAPHWVATQ